MVSRIITTIVPTAVRFVCVLQLALRETAHKLRKGCGCGVVALLLSEYFWSGYGWRIWSETECPRRVEGGSQGFEEA